MFVCMCNALKEQEMQQAAASGATCALDIYKSLGCQPVCGRCVPYVEENLVGKANAAISGDQTR